MPLKKIYLNNSLYCIIYLITMIQGGRWKSKKFPKLLFIFTKFFKGIRCITLIDVQNAIRALQSSVLT